MTTPTDSRSLQRALEDGRLSPADALAPLQIAAHEAATLALRLDACRVLGALSGRAFGAPWEVAERAAFALLAIAREADAPAERIGLLHAMGRGFRNLWLMPYVHRRLFDDDESVAAAAISAAGGLAFPALEEAITCGFLAKETSPALRLAAIAALGRMGAESAASRLVPFVLGDPTEAAAALAALTEIRSRAGEGAALETLTRDPSREVLEAAVRYLAEIGHPDVLRTLRRLSRDENADLRIAAGLATRAFTAERTNDADERILAALTEQDRAVRSALARRLRTLPVADVLAHAELLLKDDPRGVIQVIAEVRAPEVTRFLLRVAEDPSVDVAVRARAVGSVEANEAWERDALVTLVHTSHDAAIRVAAAQTLGAFAPLPFVLEHLASLAEDPAPASRAALLWALQLAARPDATDLTRAEGLVRGALADQDPSVRRRAAYVAGNLDAASLVPDLVDLARNEVDRADLRVAAFVGLGEIGSPARFTDLVFLWNREDDPHALAAASRAIERSLVHGKDTEAESASAPPSLARVHDRLRKLLASSDPMLRTAAARVAGLSPGAVPEGTLVALLDDQAPRVREQAAIALGRLGGPECAAALARALGDADPAVQERAAEALLSLAVAASTARVLDFVSRAFDRTAALRVAQRIALPRDGHDVFLQALGSALERVGPEHPVYEPLLALKVTALEATRASLGSSGGAGASSARPSGMSVDAAITKVFPTWPRLSAARGFEPLAKSLRTAEMLYAAAGHGAEADLSASIVLWMKCLEGYMHAWLGPRLRVLQAKPSTLWDLTDRILGSSWPAYQRYLGERWTDPVSVGSLEIEVPLRSVVNVLREFQDRRLKSLDSPPSVTEWSRLMLFFAVDHPSGPKNIFEVQCQDADRGVRLAHRLHVLAQVRNAVTHRSVAAEDTLLEFRRSYYLAFEELTHLA